MFLFSKAMLAGFVVALPVGAIGAMCLKRALQGLWIDGLFTGFGAAIADSILAAAAMVGLTLLTEYILDHKGPLRLIGGIVLIYLGIRMYRSRHPHLEDQVDAAIFPSRGWRWLLGDFATGFALTIINPATLLAFAGVLAGLGLFQGRTNALLDNWFVILGVFVGSMVWWMTLTAAASAVRRRASLSIISFVNGGLGLVVLTLGAISIVSLFPFIG